MDEHPVSAGQHSLHFKIRRQSDVTLAVVACQRDDFLPAFPADERGIVGTMVSELATNILKYAGEGDVLLESLEANGRYGVSIQVSDQGPGIKDLEQALADGFSTSGTLGLGLPAVKRMSDSLTITAPTGGGTVVNVMRWCRNPVASGKPSHPSEQTVANRLVSHASKHHWHWISICNIAPIRARPSVEIKPSPWNSQT